MLGFAVNVRLKMCYNRMVNSIAIAKLLAMQAMHYHYITQDCN